jgi:multimeric flavodoxin WrbA
MNIVVISGSRNSEGQTARAVGALVKGAEGAGSSVKSYYLPKMNLERCRQCEDHGWGLCRAEGRCVIEDDFAGLVEELKAADGAVFATPVYFSDLSESIRAFLDRLRRVARNNEGLHETFQGKVAIGICLAGGGGGGAPSSTVSLEKVVARCGFDVVDMIPARRQNLEMKLKVLRIVGEWFASAPKST